MRVTARIVLPGAGRKTGAGLAPSPGSAPPDTARETATLFELRSQPMWTSDPVETRDGAVLEASADFVPATPKPFDLDPGDLRITVLGPGPEPSRAIEIDGCPAPWTAPWPGALPPLRHAAAPPGYLGKAERQDRIGLRAQPGSVSRRARSDSRSAQASRFACGWRSR